MSRGQTVPEKLTTPMPNIPQNLPRYNTRETYQWNYDHAPDPVQVEVPPVPGEWTFCGLSVPSPLGMPAGPLLNGKWVLYYASLGFDVLTYKTVRSGKRACYPLPNLQPVQTGPLDGTEQRLPTQAEMAGSWAVSFGMPSQPPDVWTEDVRQTRRQSAQRPIPSRSLPTASAHRGLIRSGWLAGLSEACVGPRPLAPRSMGPGSSCDQAGGCASPCP